jgi:hypothetical protein
LYFIFRRGQHAEVDCTQDVAEQMERLGDFPDVPVSVITAGKAPNRLLMSSAALLIRLANQEKLLELSGSSKQVVAEKSGHFVQLCEPELVVDVVSELLARIRG